MISRNRSAPTAAAMSIECTTSAKRTVTCLYSADWVACVSGVPHSPQNFAVGLDCAPQEPQNSPIAVSPPPPSPLGSTSVSCHRWSTMSVISPCHLRVEVSRPHMSLSRWPSALLGPHGRSGDRWWSTRGQPSALASGEPGSDPSILEAYALLHVSNGRGARCITGTPSMLPPHP